MDFDVRPRKEKLNKEEMDGKPRSKRRTAFLWGGLLFISVLLNLAARLWSGFAEWYAVHIYPLWVGSFGRLCSLLPFSLIEILLYLGAFGLLTVFVLVLRRKMSLKGALLLLGKALIVVFCLFTLNCGINYHRTPFSERAGFSPQKYREEDLKALCRYLVEEINEAAKDISLDEKGLCVLTGDVEREAGKAMLAAAEEYPELGGYYPKAKPVLSTWYLSWQLLQGVYSPFTVEANYNRGMPAHNKPSTICHELSHLKGFMREDEANFISYLACHASDSPEFRYSGNLMAYIYSGNALYAQDPEALYEIREGLCQQAARDLWNHNVYWDAYRGTVSDVSDKVNDAYLKANAQAEGMKSYGRMVDLLLCWYMEGQGQGEEP